MDFNFFMNVLITGLTANTEYQALVDVVVNGAESLAGSAMATTSKTLESFE